MLEADNIVVVQTAMNFDLRHELLLGTTFGEGRLHDDFGGLDFLVFEVRELKALGKASLSEELAFEVLLDADVAIELDDLFFDDRSRFLSRRDISNGLSYSCHCVSSLFWDFFC